MAKQIQFRGGTTAQHSVFTGAIREITVDTDKDTLVVHDGTTVGGFPLARESIVTSGLAIKVDKNADIVGGTGTKVTYDSKGLVTSSTTPTTIAGYSIADAYTKTEVDNKISALVDSAPETLDTLNELAAALGDDPNFATTVTNSIATKVVKNADITFGTNTKITYDAKGLVTGGSTPTTLAGYSIANAYTKTEVDSSLALKVDDTEIASVNLLRADKYLSAQNVAKTTYDVNKKLIKVQYNNATDVDYEVLSYTNGKLTNVAHYVGSVLKGNTVLTYVSGSLDSAPFIAV